MLWWNEEKESLWEQRPKAERNIAVATTSILTRDEFITQ